MSEVIVDAMDEGGRKRGGGGGAKRAKRAIERLYSSLEKVDYYSTIE